MSFYSSPSPVTFQAVLEIRGSNNVWSTYNFLLEGQLLIPRQLDNNNKSYGSLNISGCNCVKVPPEKAQYKLFPFKVVMSGTKYVLNASSETLREQCILLIKLAARDTGWVNPFYGLEVDQEQRLIPQQQIFEAVVHVRKTDNIEKASWKALRLVLRGQYLSLLDLAGDIGERNNYQWANGNSSMSCIGDLVSNGVKNMLLLAPGSCMVSKLSPADADGKTYPFALAAQEVSSPSTSTVIDAISRSASFLFSTADELMRERCIMMLKLATVDNNWINPFYQRQLQPSYQNNIERTLSLPPSPNSQMHSNTSGVQRRSTFAGQYEKQFKSNDPDENNGLSIYNRNSIANSVTVNTIAQRNNLTRKNLSTFKQYHQNKIDSTPLEDRTSLLSNSLSTRNSLVLDPSLDPNKSFQVVLEIRRNKKTNEWSKFNFVLLNNTARGEKSVKKLLAYDLQDEQFQSLQGTMDISNSKVTALSPKSAGGKYFAFKVVASGRNSTVPETRFVFNASSNDLRAQCMREFQI